MSSGKKIKEKDKIENSPREDKLIAVKLDKVLYDIVDEHIRALTSNKRSKVTRNEWLETALTDKLEKAKLLSARSVPREKHITVKVKRDVEEELERRIAFLSSLTKGYSKKRFILEAILEKIEQEKVLLMKTLEERDVSKNP